VDALSFRQHEQLFHELAQFSRSGIPLSGALEMLCRSPQREIGNQLRALRDNFRASGDAGRAFRDAGFSESDAAIIKAGEETGRLDTVFLELGAYYHQLAEARGTVIAKSIYPILVLHAGAVLLAIPPAILDGHWTTFLAQSLPILATFYVAVALGTILWKTARALLARNVAAARVLMRIPVLGNFLGNWTAWKFASILSLYVGAGGGLLRAFETAAASCENAVIKSASLSALSAVQRGRGLAEAFREQRGIPKLLERSIEVGEHTGRLEEESRRAAEILKSKTLGALDALAQWMPRILYLLIVLFTVWRILAAASDVINSVNSALNVET
jgi:type II secretory pathway component PulF